MHYFRKHEPCKKAGQNPAFYVAISTQIRPRTTLRYAAVSALRHRYPVRFVCLVLYASVSGYYARLKRNAAPPSKATRLEAGILAAHQRTRGTYDAERLHQEVYPASVIFLWRCVLAAVLAAGAGRQMEIRIWLLVTPKARKCR